MTELFILSVIWSVMALFNVVIASVVWQSTEKTLMAAKEAYPEDDIRLEIAYTNRNSARYTSFIQYIFLIAGVAVLILDPMSMLRLTITRYGLLLGQFLFTLTILNQYRTDKRLNDDGDD